MDLISIVVPCYNEQEALPEFYKEVKKIAKTMDYVEFEFIFVDDGSKDKTLPMLRLLHSKDSRVRFISLSRNFGKEAGMLAGLKLRREIMLRLWTLICRILRRFFPKCTRQ